MSDDELPELRLLDEPMEAPDEFRLRLRSDLVATFDEAASDETGSNVVRLSRRDEPAPERTAPRWGLLGAAAALMVVAVGAIGLIASNRSEPEPEVAVTDRAAACERLAADAPAAPLLFGDTTDESGRSVERRVEAIDQMRAAVDEYLENAARLGFASAADVSNLVAASGALNEARLDLEQGDADGSAEAIDFAIDRLEQVSGVGVLGSSGQLGCVTLG